MNVLDVFTEFIFLEDKPERSDIIFVPGSDEGVLAVRAAELWKESYAPVILPSGRYGKLTGRFTGDPAYGTEWEYLHHVLREQGVAEDAIWREDRATFTYENALRSREVTDAAGMSVRTAILCCQAYHARRASLYYQACFPEAKILVSPVVTKGISRENWYRSEEGVRLVLTEVEHCGSQFGEVVRNAAEKKLTGRLQSEI